MNLPFRALCKYILAYVHILYHPSLITGLNRLELATSNAFLRVIPDSPVEGYEEQLILASSSVVLNSFD